MADLDIYTAGAARMTDAGPVCHVTLDVDEDSDIREDMGEIPIAFGVGFVGLPLAPSDAGKAEVICAPAGGFTGMCIGGRDSRCKDVIGAMQGGDSAMFSTGGDPDKRAKVFAKEDSASMLVGNDTAFVINRSSKVATLSVPDAGMLELSQSNGFMVGDTSGAGIQIQGGKVLINGGSISLPGGVHIGGTAAVPLVKSVGLLSYLGALETLLVTLATALDAKTPASPGVNLGAANAFISAGSALKTAMTALVTNGQ